MFPVRTAVNLRNFDSVVLNRQNTSDESNSGDEDVKNNLHMELYKVIGILF